MIILIPLSIIILWAVIGYITFRVFLLRVPKKKARQAPRSDDHRQGPPAFRMDRDWLAERVSESWMITSRDGLHLNARFLPGTRSGIYAICCHGYRANAASSAGFARIFFELGCSVLMPDARAHGKSEGRYIGMGCPERYDLAEWIREIIAHDPSAKIILFGVSMGAATVMNTIGQDLSANVICAIEDCGYISAREIFLHQLKCRHLPRFLLYAAAPYTRLLAGFSALSENLTRDALRNSRLPILMIHGAADHFVPPDHMRAAADACGSNARTIIFPGAKHAESILTDPFRYRSIIAEFLQQFI